MSLGSASEIYVGVMSGTSLDGIDAVAADFSTPRPQVLGHAHAPFEPGLRSALLELNRAGTDELARAALASRQLVDAAVPVIRRVLGLAGLQSSQVRAVGMHGQTVRHRPDLGYTIQLNAPARMAEALGIEVIADFRSRDLAAGGHGAPLVPAFHAKFFSGAEPRAIVNIGGIANVTLLPAMGQGEVRGFDCGPGNVLLDLWAQRHLGVPMDEGGRWARGGRVDEALLTIWRRDAFLVAAPPKSTGRDRFNADWLAAATPADRDPQDVQASLVELTAAAIADAVERWHPSARHLIVCGGGARNAYLMERISRRSPRRAVAASDAFGVDPTQVEALAFAWLARACVRGDAGNLPAVTGARGPRVLGARYPA